MHIHGGQTEEPEWRICPRRDKKIDTDLLLSPEAVEGTPNLLKASPPVVDTMVTNGRVPDARLQSPSLLVAYASALLRARFAGRLLTPQLSGTSIAKAFIRLSSRARPLQTLLHA